MKEQKCKKICEARQFSKQRKEELKHHTHNKKQQKQGKGNHAQLPTRLMPSQSPSKGSPSKGRRGRNGKQRKPEHSKQ